MLRRNFLYVLIFGLFLSFSPISNAYAQTSLSDQLNNIDKRLTFIESELSKLSKKESKLDIGVISSLIVGVIAAISGFGVAYYTQRSTIASSKEARLLDSLKWFEKGTQPRSIGLSIVEANWESTPELRSTWTSVLVNQGIYLLAEKSKDEVAQHELENRRRIVKLLKKAKLSKGQQMALAEAVTEAQHNRNQVDQEELKDWGALAGLSNKPAATEQT